MYENKRNYHSELLHNVFQGINYIFQKPNSQIDLTFIKLW